MRLKVASVGKRRIHVRRPDVPPGAATVVGRCPGAFGAQTGSEQLRFPRARLFPLIAHRGIVTVSVPARESRLHLRMIVSVQPTDQRLVFRSSCSSTVCARGRNVWPSVSPAMNQVSAHSGATCNRG